MTELRALTGLRGLAALAVVFYHVRSEIPLNEGAWPVVFRHGYLGVDFFFVLSGFILAYVYRDYDFFAHRALIRYLGLRLARIYPAHIAALAVFGLFAFATGYAGVHAERFTLSELLTHLTLTSAWGLHPSNSWNIPAWSISAEMFAYLNLPLLFLLYAWMTRLLGGLRAASVLAVGGYGILFIVPVLNDGSIGSSTFLALIRVICEFTMGFAGYRLSVGRAGRSSFWTGLLVSSVLAITIVLAYDLPDILVVPAALGIIVALAWASGWVLAVFGHPILNELGRISYALYLVHYPVLVAFHLVIYRLEPPRILWGLLGVVASIGVAVALNRLVEEPMRRAIRRRLPEQPE